MKRAINATLGLGTAALLSLAACGGGDTGADMADTGLGATVPAPAPAPMDTMMPDTMMPDTMMPDTMMPDTMMRDTTMTPPPSN